jgi:hypothetical protein
MYPKSVQSWRSFFLASLWWLFPLALFYIHLGHFANDPNVGHNSISNILPAIAPSRGLGVPYRDYWDIYPPGIYLFWSIFSPFVVHGLWMAKLFHLILNFCFAGIFSELVKIYLSKQSEWIKWASWISFLVILTSTSIQSQLLSNTLIASLFSLLGFYFCAKRFTPATLLLSSFLLTTSGLIKDPFIFAAGAPLLALFHFRKDYPKNYFLFPLLGIFLSLFLHAGYLLHLEVMGDYFQMVQAKRALYIKSAFDLVAPNRVLFFIVNLFRSLFLIGGFPTLVALYILQRKAKFQLLEVLGFLFFLLHLMGFNLQQKPRGIYLLEMLAPALILLWSFYRVDQAAPNRSRNETVKKTLQIAFLLLLLPNFDALKTVFSEPKLNPAEMNRAIFAEPNHGDLAPALKSILAQDPRVMQVYGWGSPLFYFNTHTKPFNRFFILHASILGEKQREEWVRSFQKELPKIVLYGAGVAADMDVQTFESQTLQLKLLLQNCYRKEGGAYLLRETPCRVFQEQPEWFIAPRYLISPAKK